MKRLLACAAALLLLLSLPACQSDLPLTEVIELPTDESTGVPTQETENSVPTAMAEPLPATEADEVTFLADGNATIFRVASGDVWAQVCVTVENTGTVSIVLPAMDIALLSEGVKVKSIPAVTAYPNVLEPGQTGCYFDVVRLDTEELFEAEMQCVLAPEKTEQSLHCYTISGEPLLRDTVYGGLTLTGEVKNETAEDCAGMLCIAAVLYDTDDTVLCVLYDYPTEQLGAGQTYVFTLDSFMLPDGITASDAVRIEVFAYEL